MTEKANSDSGDGGVDSDEGIGDDAQSSNTRGHATRVSNIIYVTRQTH